MKMTKILAMAAVAGATALTAGASDPGGYPGFVKAVFKTTSSCPCNTTSNVFENATSWCFYPEEMYASDLDEYTTVAWGAYMWMEGGVQYDFKGRYDDYAVMTIDSTKVLTLADDILVERTGSFTPTTSDWYKIDLRIANKTSRGGCYGNYYGILWKKSTETTWRKFVANSEALFKTGTLTKELKNTSKPPIVEVISSEMRKNDPTVMDVKYYVLSASEKVDVRVLGFKDGTRSFANVVRVETLLDGSVFGDNVAANTTNSFAWKVSSDWKVDLANVAIEVLAKNAGEGLVPLEWATIPANGKNVEMTVSKNTLTKDQVFDALLWLYASKDETLSLKSGVLMDSYGIVAVGKTTCELGLDNWKDEILAIDLAESGVISYDDYEKVSRWNENESDGLGLNAARHIFQKMGFENLNDSSDLLTYVRSARREAMSSPYGYALKK